MLAYTQHIMERATISAPTPQTRIRPDIITDQFLAILRQHNVIDAKVFGSVTRGTEGPGSDIDLLTELHPVFAPYILPTLVDLPL
jgi:predicted nucleotidyltransferase